MFIEDISKGVVEAASITTKVFKKQRKNDISPAAFNRKGKFIFSSIIKEKWVKTFEKKNFCIIFPTFELIKEKNWQFFNIFCGIININTQYRVINNDSITLKYA